MSDRNKAVLEQANAAIAKGDYEGFLARCTDDTDWTFVGEHRLRGKTAVREYMRRTYTEPPRFHVERMIAGDESVVAMGRITLAGADGRDVEYEYCDVWRLRDGKLAELRAYVVPAGGGMNNR